MKTNVKRLTFGILFLLISIPIVWTVIASRAAETSPSINPSEHATAGELHQLLKARYDIAANLLDSEEKRLEDGRATLKSVYEAARRVRDSAMELTAEPAEQLAALTKYLAVTRRVEESMNRVVDQGVAPSSDRELARYLRLDAEIALLRVKLHESAR
jgi:hypothetical protein